MGNGPGKEERRSKARGSMVSSRAAGSVAVLEPIPADSSVVTRRFEEVLDDMAIKEDVKETMRMFPPEKKWMIVQQNQKKHDEDEKHSEDPVEWANKVETEYANAETYLQLMPIINSSSKRWINVFIEAGGLEHMLEAGRALHFELHDSGALLLPCLRCVNAVMNNEVGLKAILEDAKAIECITMWFDSRNIQVKSTVLKFLSVFALLGQTDVILDSFSKLKEVSVQHRPRLYPIIDALHRYEDADMTLKLFVFINTSIINCGSGSLEERAAVRGEYLDLGIGDAIEKVRVRTLTLKGIAVESLLKQIGLYEALYSDDRRETMVNEVDMSNPDAVFYTVRSICTEEGYVSQLLAILHQLLLIPHDMIGDTLWNAISEVTQYAVSGRDTSDEDYTPFLTYEELKDRMGSLGDVSDRYKSKMEELGSSVEEGRREVHQLKMKATYHEEQLQKKDAEIEALRAEMSSIKKGVFSKGSSGPTAKLPPPPSASTPDATPESPPPPPPASTPAPAAPPPPAAPAAPPAPAAPGAPPAPGAPAVNANEPPPGMKAKKEQKPSKKVRNFHWSKIPNNKIKGTVWEKLDDERVQVPKKELTDLFGVAVKAKTSSGSKKVAKKAEVVTLLDEKRAQNINLSMARFKVSPGDIHDAIMAMDESVLNAERLAQFAKNAPTREEIDTVRSFDGNKKMLGHAEQLFLAVADIKCIQQRLDLWLFKQTFAELIEDTKSKLGLVLDSFDRLQRSKSFLRLLEIVLGFGNFLNGGTKKGMAYGFKLSTLKQLVQTKATDKKTTLLMIIVEHCRKNEPSVLEFKNEFQVLQDAIRIESRPFLAEIRKLIATFESVVPFAKSDAIDPSKDRFASVMEKFVDQNKSTVSSLSNGAKKAEELTTTIASQFGEPASVTWEELFQTFDQFSSLWAGAEKEIEKREAAAQKEKERKEATERRGNGSGKGDSIKSLGNPSGAGADKLYKQLIDVDLKSIMGVIKERRANKPNKVGRLRTSSATQQN